MQSEKKSSSNVRSKSKSSSKTGSDSKEMKYKSSTFGGGDIKNDEETNTKASSHRSKRDVDATTKTTTGGRENKEKRTTAGTNKSSSDRHEKSSHRRHRDGDYDQYEDDEADGDKSKAKHQTASTSSSSRRKSDDRADDDDRRRAARHHRTGESRDEAVRNSKTSAGRDTVKPTAKDSHRKDRYKDREAANGNSDTDSNGKRAQKEADNEAVNDYEDDFDDDFDDEDNDDERESYEAERRSRPPPTPAKQSSKRADDERDEEDDAERHRKQRSSEYQRRRRSSGNSGGESNERTGGGGRIIRANAHVAIPTESVQVYASRIVFNHDSLDRQRRRAADLLKSNTIELDRKRFSLLDINPTEMRTIYSSYMKHQKVQTNDDVVEIETQTDDIELVTKWTQHPADDSKGFGTGEQSDRTDAELSILERFRAEINFVDLHAFLRNSSRVVESLLDEALSSEARADLATNKSDLEFSAGFCLFALPKPLATRLAKHAALAQCTFSDSDARSFVATYSLPAITRDNMTSSLLAVWSVNDQSTPTKLLICDSLCTCLCYFSFIVISGNIDGSVSVWDLRESTSMHRLKPPTSKTSSATTTAALSADAVLRSPTYTTASVLHNDNHLSEIKSVIPLQSDSHEANTNSNSSSSKGIFMQVATLDIDCKLIIWTLVELKNTDLTVFETDLGLMPGGKIKLVKSSTIELTNLVRGPLGSKIAYQTQGMTLSRANTNEFYISTNVGQIIHVTRRGNAVSTALLKTSLENGALLVSSVAFHAEVQDIILAGYGNGEIRLYHTSFLTPIKTWVLACIGARIRQMQWIASRSGCFFIIDEADTLYIWDLLVDDTQPIVSKQIAGIGGISFSTSSKSAPTSENDKSCGASFLLFNQNSKEVELHYFTNDWSKKSDKESRKFQKLIKNYLVTF